MEAVMLTAIETTATIRAKRELVLDEDLPKYSHDKVRVIVLLADEELNEKDWQRTAAQNEAFDFLNNEDDIYSLEDGLPLAK